MNRAHILLLFRRLVLYSTIAGCLAAVARLRVVEIIAGVAPERFGGVSAKSAPLPRITASTYLFLFMKNINCFKESFLIY